MNLYKILLIEKTITTLLTKYYYLDIITIEVICLSKRNSVFKLELLILCILRKKDYYGYEISSIIEEKTQGIFNLKEGTMYPILYNLLENECITSYEEIFKSRVRVYYHLEKKGEKYLEELKDEFLTKVKLIQDIISEED